VRRHERDAGARTYRCTRTPPKVPTRTVYDDGFRGSSLGAALRATLPPHAADAPDAGAAARNKRG
jgi:hypothetical protein